MKRSIYYLSINLLFIALFTSCSKNEDVKPTTPAKPQTVAIGDFVETLTNQNFSYLWNPAKKFVLTNGGYFGKGQYFGLEQGDTLNITFTASTSTDQLDVLGFDISDLNNEIQLRRYANKTTVTDKIVITKRMVIAILTYGKTFGSNINIKLSRTPQSTQTQNFNTTLKWADSKITVPKNTQGASIEGEWVEVKKGIPISLSGTLIGTGSSRNVIPISEDLPENTLYWVYRFVCNNKGAKDNFDRNERLLEEIKNLKLDPRVTAAAAVLQLLNQPPGTAKCDVVMLQNFDNRGKFLNKDDTYRFYPDFSATEVNAYKQGVSLLLPQMFLGFQNKAISSSVDINLTIVAAVERAYLIAKIPSF
jgi:hypothetical protein